MLLPPLRPFLCFPPSIRGIFAPCGPLVVVLPVRQLCLWATTLMHITTATLPLARLYCIGFSLQSCHLPDFIALVSVYNPYTCQTISSVSFDSRTTCQIVLHGCQFTAVSLARLYFIGCSLQSCQLSDFIAVFSVYSRATGQILLQWIRFTAYHWSDLTSLVSGGNPDACQTLFHGFSLRTDAC